MAKAPRRRRKPRSPRRLSAGTKAALFLLIVGAIAAGYAWHEGRSWRPDEAVWPDQGALIGAADGAVDFGTLAGLGAQFVYLEASDGAGRKDVGFAQNFARARRSGLAVGAAHRFDPCAVADGQSANFVTIVPRDPALLPPAIELSDPGADCIDPVDSGQVRSELTILANQIEAHAGKPAILKVSREFEAAHGVAARIERNLWLVRTRFEPDYGGRPWLLWTANENYVGPGSEEPIEWMVVRP